MNVRTITALMFLLGLYSPLVVGMFKMPNHEPVLLKNGAQEDDVKVYEVMFVLNFLLLQDRSTLQQLVAKAYNPDVVLCDFARIRLSELQVLESNDQPLPVMRNVILSVFDGPDYLCINSPYAKDK